MLKNSEIVLQLSKSQVYRDYEKAFNQSMQLPLVLRPHEIWHQALHGKKHENPFCALLAKTNRTCAACLQVQQELTSGKSGRTTSVTCFAGLCDTAIPVSAGKDVIGFLQTGQVALGEPTAAGFSKISLQLVDWGIKVDLNELHDAYFHSKVLRRQQYEGMIRLLEIFANHLSLIANQVLVKQQNTESPLVSKAKKYISEHQAESLSLGQMAQFLNMSTFYFCKMFKKTTGLTFTDYLARTRVERAKNLLLNPNVRVSEVAYDCGFISLTHFNRVFKRLVGKSPTQFRHSLIP